MTATLQHIIPTQTQPSQRRESQSSLAYPSRTIVHAKLEMTEPGDHDEQEADAVASTIVSGGKIARKISSGGGSSGIAVSQQMESQLSQLQGGGRQMPEGLRNMMESGFGQDFSQVRLHTDSEAASMSSSIHAKAFTLGNDIYFNQGEFSPETSEGQHLVAHELTHVVQGTGKVGRKEKTDFSKIKAPDFLNKNDKEAIDDIINHLVKTAIKEVNYKEKSPENGPELVNSLQNTEDELKRVENELKDPNLTEENKTKLEKEKKTLNETRSNIKKQLNDLSLDDKKGEGSGNFTKYQRDLNQYLALGQAWCDLFVHWCFVKAFDPINVEDRNKTDNNFTDIRNGILENTMFEHKDYYVRGSVSNNLDLFKEHSKIAPESYDNNPKKGDVVFFYNDEKEPGHIGIVIEVTGNSVFTIEGNTSYGGYSIDEGSGKITKDQNSKDGKNNFELNGNGVFIKEYDLNCNRIIGYGHPNYAGLLNYLRDVYKTKSYIKK